LHELVGGSIFFPKSSIERFAEAGGVDLLDLKHGRVRPAGGPEQRALHSHDCSLAAHVSGNLTYGALCMTNDDLDEINVVLLALA
jgi:hypothetical protein